MQPTQEELVLDIDAALASNGYGELPIWVTNVAWATYGEEGFVVEESEQAEYLTWAMGSFESLVDQVFWMELRDTEPPEDHDPSVFPSLTSILG